MPIRNSEAVSMAKLGTLLTAAILSITSCGSQRPTLEAPAVQSTLHSQSLTAAPNALFHRDLYDYGASIIQEGNVRKYWWCGQDPAASDAIFYRTYDSSTGQYSPIIQVLSPNPSAATWDRSYICDPSVIQGQFTNPDNNLTYSYAMYYTATDRGPGTAFAGTLQDGTNNRIGVAYSNDGMTWTRYSQNPIVQPQTSPTDTYGAGQGATYNSDGQGGVRIMYTDFSLGSERLFTRTSTDGRTFSSPTMISNAGVLAGQTPNIGNGDLAFDYVGRFWYATFALGYPSGPSGSTVPNISAPGFRAGDRERYQFGLYRMAETQFPSGSWQLLGYVDTNSTGKTINHNAALVRDKWGNVNTTLPTIETVFSAGANDNTTWDLYSATWNAGSTTLPLKQYYNSSIMNYWTTSGFVGSGFLIQKTLGDLQRGPVAGTVPLYGCQAGSSDDRFLSTQANCEGQYPLGVNGFIYSTQPGTPSTVALYRCYTGRGHFVSLQANCEGSTSEGLLGYALGTGETQPPTTTTLGNVGFETPAVSGFQYVPSGAIWTFTGVSGIQRNGSAFGAAAAPDGFQTAFLQGSSTGLGGMSQTVTLNAGGYSLKFKAAQRPGQVQTLRISLDGVQVGPDITASGSSFADYSSSNFNVSQGNHTIKIEATDASGDNSVFLDSFSLQANTSNLALNKPVTSNNSFEYSAWGVAKLTDGIFTTDPTSYGFTSNAYSNANLSGNPVYVDVDLGIDQPVKSVTLYPRTDLSAAGGGSPNFPVNFTVQTAVNGSTTYSTVATVTAQANPGLIAQTYSFPVTSARHVRIVVTGLGSPASDEPSTYRLQLSELTAF